MGAKGPGQRLLNEHQPVDPRHRCHGDRNLHVVDAGRRHRRVANGAERHPQALDGSERGGIRPLQRPAHVGMGDQLAGLVDEEGMARARGPYARDQLPDELEIDLRDDDAGRAAIAPTATLMKGSEPPAKVTDPNQTAVPGLRSRRARPTDRRRQRS
jgi:hypothetical protein